MSWVLGSYDSDGTMTDVPSDLRIDALFEKGRIGGSSGVNTFNGDNTLDGEKITIGPLAMTEMASEDPKLMEQETAYVAALQSASQYNTKGNRLELRREDGALAVSYEAGE